MVIVHGEGQRGKPRGKRKPKSRRAPADGVARTENLHRGGSTTNESTSKRYPQSRQLTTFSLSPGFVSIVNLDTLVPQQFGSSGENGDIGVRGDIVEVFLGFLVRVRHSGGLIVFARVDNNGWKRFSNTVMFFQNCLLLDRRACLITPIMFNPSVSMSEVKEVWTCLTSEDHF